MSPAHFRRNRILHALLLWLTLFWIVTAIGPVDRDAWLMENVLVFAYLILLAVTYRRFAFSNLSYALFTLFLTLHLIGAHYTYTEAPAGFWMQQAFGFERNHYDRLVHFAYGLLCAYAFREVLLRAAGVRTVWSYFLAAVGVLAFSAFYEMLEMVVVVLIAPELGPAYLGIQGDEWDAQKDGFLAFFGAGISMYVCWLMNRATTHVS